MPKLWSETIDAHRRDVRDAVLETTWALVTEHGLLSVTMSSIAEAVGIGRATLYKYFPDVESILLAWHEEHVLGHLEHLDAVRSRGEEPAERLQAVMEAYARICHHRSKHGSPDLAALLHRGDQVAGPHRRLHGLFRDLIAECTAAGQVRDDVTPAELAHYCIHALSAAGSLPSVAAVRRLVAVTRSAIGADARRAGRPRRR